MAGKVKNLDTAVAIKPVVAPKTAKVEKPVVKGTPVVADGSTYKKVDGGAEKLVKVSPAVVGGQQSRIDAFLKKGAINTPEALLAKLDGMTDMAAAEFLGTVFADSIKGIS